MGAISWRLEVVWQKEKNATKMLSWKHFLVTKMLPH